MRVSKDLELENEESKFNLLGQCFAALATDQNHLGSFKKMLMPGPNPRDSDLIGLGRGHASGFKSSRGF